MKTVKYNGSDIIPSKVVCIGRNYVDHIKELENETPDSMVIFNKPNSAISDKLKYISKDTRFEGEICFLVANNALKGIGFGLDLTRADIQNKLKEKRLPWERAKSFDGSAVLSEFVPFDGAVQRLTMELFINDERIQYANYDLMIYKPHEMLEEIKTFMSLEDGDIIMSGTPKGVSNYEVGDVFTAFIYDDNQLLVQCEWIVE